MPELPEVETTVRGIQSYLANAKVKQVVVRQSRLRWPVPKGINRTLAGQKILAVNRRAKYILLGFPHGTLLIHLGMSGRLRVLPKSIPPQKHDHVDLLLGNGKVLRYHDPRRFGCVLWLRGDPLTSRLLVHLGPEPFDQGLSGSDLFATARGRRTAVKNFIMNGQVIVGVGNIYASEALFRAGIRPARAAGRVTRIQYHRLLQAIRDVLQEAITAGGTTLRDYSQVNGKPGFFEQSLQVYDRAGEPCVNCGSAIRRKVIGQRASYYCSQCQL